jgi:hypothetical protein
MKKSDAIKLAGSPTKLARLLGVAKQSVNSWKEDAIPELRVYQLKELHPEWFGLPKRRRSRVAA